MTDRQPLKAPFPWPGGKSRVADLVWSRLGNVDNYVGSRTGDPLSQGREGDAVTGGDGPKATSACLVVGHCTGHRLFTPRSRPSGALGRALGAPACSLTGLGERADAVGEVIRGVLSEVFGLRHHLQVGDDIVQLVPVLVVNHHPPRHRPVVFLPDEDSPQFPHVRLRDLDPCSAFAAPLVAGPDGDRANGEPVV
jgi:hypothetical protein